MAEPYSYNASAESCRVPEASQPTIAPTPKIEGDPLQSFEQFHFQVQTDLRGWMTYAKGDRFKKAVAYVKTMEDKDRKIDLARRHKILNYIIWVEGTHPQGSRDVAGVAFNGIFPKSNG